MLSAAQEEDEAEVDRESHTYFSSLGFIAARLSMPGRTYCNPWADSQKAAWVFIVATIEKGKRRGTRHGFRLGRPGRAGGSRD